MSELLSRRSPIRVGLWVWTGLTAACLLHLGLTTAIWGKPALQEFLREGPDSRWRITMVAVALCWGLAGFALVVAAARRIALPTVFLLSGFFAVALLYTNVMRERTVFSDSEAYFAAGASLYSGDALPMDYLYPPLLATLLAPMTPLSTDHIAALWWAVNLF